MPHRVDVAQAKAELFKALGHPLRVRVLERLVEREHQVGELAELLGAELSHLSQQLAVLRRAGVVVARRERSSVYYSVRDPRLSQLLVIAKQLLLLDLQDVQSMLVQLQSEAIAPKRQR